MCLFCVIIKGCVLSLYFVIILLCIVCYIIKLKFVRIYFDCFLFSMILYFKFSLVLLLDKGYFVNSNYFWFKIFFF